MNWFYLRWLGLLVVAVILAVLTFMNYRQNLASVTPKSVLNHTQSDTPLRVKGMVKSGTLTGNIEEGQVRFELGDGSGNIPVQYDGPPPENLRELKTLIVIGQWDAVDRRFLAKEIALVTNYGFVVSAYLVTMIALAWFIFGMSRKVGLLFQEIKQTALYEPEEYHHGN